MTSDNTTKPTPGPWEFEDIGEDGDNLRINQWERMEANKVAIAIIPIGYSEPFESEQQANARLIASAPELLEALETLAEFCHRYCAESSGKDLYVGKARAVIQKATGAEETPVSDEERP